MFVRAYLRASTKEQDATRARADLEAFAAGRGLTIATFYVENESGASLHRPELFRLLSDSRPGDVLLVEQVDRLSRLNAADWERLREEIRQRQVKVVALDLPTSWQLAAAHSDDFTARMAEAINGMLLDMLAAIARKDYEDRRRRQAQGIEKAKASGVYTGRPEDTKRNAAILSMLRSGQSWNTIITATGCSRSTLARLAKRHMKETRTA
ncbi:resolvase [Devosia sp. DBB001]|nr:resolvase [Devosia sp. DBB001]